MKIFYCTSNTAFKSLSKSNLCGEGNLIVFTADALESFQQRSTNTTNCKLLKRPDDDIAEDIPYITPDEFVTLSENATHCIYWND